MQADVDLLLTSQALFEDAVEYYSDRESYTFVNESTFQVGELRFRLLMPGEDRSAIEAWDIYRVFRKWKTLIAYLGESYEVVKHFSERDLRTIWLNRSGSFAPLDIPIHDGDILSFQNLSNVFSLLHKPTLDQCTLWWDEWDLPQNIRRHSQTVAWGAYVLAVMMRNRGIDIDPILTHRGGLLHDIDKIETLEQNGQHGKIGADFLLRNGYPALAEIVGSHIMNSILEPDAEDRPWEAKLVYFTDKLVEGDQIVTFDVRQEALKRRYPEYQGVMDEARSKIWALSDQICSILSIPSHRILISHLIGLQYT